MTTVAVIGLGAMGSRMARRLLNAGHDVIVWNRTSPKTKPLAELGAIPVATPAEAARAAEAVFPMVSDPAALRNVVEGPDGVAAGAGDSTTVIQMSTVGPEAVTRLASVLSARTALLDAPVLGSLSEAEGGTLRIFVGGSPELFERWTPLLSALGTPLHVGPLGAGSAAKLVANSTLLGVLGVLGEALLLAKRLGLRNRVAFEVLEGTPLAAQAERRSPFIQSGEYPLRFRLSLAVKDAGLILWAGDSHGEHLRLAEAVRGWLADAEDSGMGERDYSAVIDYILRSVPPTRHDR